MTDPTEGRVVSLPADLHPPPEKAPAPTPPGPLHGLAIGGLAVSALVGVVALFALVSVSWPHGIHRTLIIIFSFSILTFLTSASVAVFSAARDTYATRGPIAEAQGDDD